MTRRMSDTYRTGAPYFSQTRLYKTGEWTIVAHGCALRTQTDESPWMLMLRQWFRLCPVVAFPPAAFIGQQLGTSPSGRDLVRETRTCPVPEWCFSLLLHGSRVCSSSWTPGV